MGKTNTCMKIYKKIFMRKRLLIYIIFQRWHGSKTLGIQYTLNILNKIQHI
jgi:hypothetical protein